MRLSSLLKAALLVGVVGTVTMIGAVKAIDLERIKALLSQQIAASTGRPLTIKGPLTLRLGLSPMVTARDVAFGNAAGGSRPAMVTVERIEAYLDLLPLLKRSLVIKRLVLFSPDLLLEGDGHGRANWHLPAPSISPAAATGVTPLRFDLAEILIRNGRLSWRDGGDGQTVSAALHKLALQSTPDGTAMRLQVEGDWRGTSFDLGGSVGSPLASTAARPWPVQIKGSFAGAVGLVEGKIANPLTASGLDLQVELQGDELTRLLGLAGVKADGHPLPRTGPFKLSGHLDDQAGTLRLGSLDAAIGRRDLALVSAKGEIGNLLAGRGVDLRLGIESDNLGGLSALGLGEVAPIGPLKAAARLTDRGKAWDVADLKGRLAGSDFGGELEIRPGARPLISGKLDATRFVLADLSNPAAKPGEKRSDTAKPVSKPDGRIFPDTKLPTPPAAIDADVTLAPAQLMVGGSEIDGLTARLRLDRGRLTLATINSGHLADGNIEGTLSLGEESASLRLDADGLDLGRLLEQPGEPSPLVGGPIRLHLDLSARGDTPRALMASLSGDGLIALGEARLKAASGGTAAPLAATMAQLDPGSGETETALHCAVIRFQARDGIATARKGLALESGRIALLGAGSVDLRTETLALALVTKPHGGATGVMRIGGTLAAPRLGGDAEADLTVAAGTAERIVSADHPCQIALGQKAKPAAKPAKRRK